MRLIKIFEDEKELYSSNCYVNMTVFRGRIHGDLKEAGQDGLKFTLQLSNGKNEKTGEWYKPTFADCIAFGEVKKRILKEYKSGDEIWIVAKFQARQYDGVFYKNFIVREIVNKVVEKVENKKADEDLFDDELPF